VQISNFMVVVKAVPSLFNRLSAAPGPVTGNTDA
jgi:hypothetical protein